MHTFSLSLSSISLSILPPLLPQLDLIVPDLAQANQGNNLTTVLIPFTTITVPLRGKTVTILVSRVSTHIMGT